MFWIMLILALFHTGLIWSVHRFVAKFWHRIGIWAAVWLLLGLIVLLTVNAGGVWNTIFGLSVFSCIILPTVVLFYAMTAYQAQTIDTQILAFEAVCKALGAEKTSESKSTLGASCSLNARYKNVSLFFSHFPRTINKSVYYHSEIAISLPEGSPIRGSELRLSIERIDDSPKKNYDTALDEHYTKSLICGLQTDRLEFWQRIFSKQREDWLQTEGIYGAMRIEANWLHFSSSGWHISKKEDIERARKLLLWLYELANG